MTAPPAGQPGPPDWSGPPVGGPPPGWPQPYQSPSPHPYPAAPYPYPGAAPYPAAPYPYPAGYLPPGGGPPGFPWKPGVIPLRPLTLTDVFSGAVGYVRANPAATLGLTAAVVVITSVLQLVVEIGQPAAGAAITAGLATALATILLSGMLTVVVARSVLGSPITVAQAWHRVRGRLVALVVLSLLEVAAVAALIGGAVLVIAGVARASSGGVAALVGLPLVILTVSAIVYLLTVLSFGPVATVLERKPVPDAIRRSVSLTRRHFWRILGIRALASFLAFVVAGVVTVPFGVVGALVSAGEESAGAAIAAAVIAAVGGMIGQIITAPFTAGVVVLLYVDARIRSEAFDRVLQAGARGAFGGDPDDLWLTGGAN